MEKEVTSLKSSQVDFRQVLRPSPFQEKIKELGLVEDWMSWNGYKAARSFDTLAAEYFAIRSTCSVMDLTPMELSLIHI